MKKILVYTCLNMALSLSTFAAETLNPLETEFLKSYISATQSKNAEDIKKLLHPLNLQCMNAENKKFYDYYFNRLSKRPVPSAYKLSVREVDPQMFEKEKGYLLGPDTTIPVTPTRKISLDYEVKDTDPKTGCSKFHMVLDTSVHHAIHLAQHEGKLKMVLGCVSTKTINMMNEKEARELEMKKKATELFKQLDPNLRTRLIQLVKVDLKTLSAIKLYETEAKVSRTEANLVVDMLCDEI